MIFMICSRRHDGGLTSDVPESGGGSPSETIPSSGRSCKCAPPVVNQRFVIKTPFRNRSTGKTTYAYILNSDGHIDVAHQMGLVSLTTEIIDQWKEEVPAGVDENNNPRMDVTWWIRVQATAVVANQRSPTGITTTTAYCTAHDRDRFVKSPEYLLAVAETRAKKRALSDACNITEAMIHPEGKEATREAEGLPIDGGADDEPKIPGDVRRNIPDITPPLSRDITHASATKGAKEQFQI